MNKSNIVTIGLRAKTGRAIAVVLGGSIESPSVLTKLEIKLTDPKIPATFQPYHEVMDLPWEESQRAVRKYVRAIEMVARKSLADLIKRLTSEGMTVKGVGIVGSKDSDLARIGNYHIRAHAAEGILFRRVLELAAENNRVTSRAFADRDLEKTASAELKIESAALKRRLNELGKTLSPPWRTDEKQAAAAAWLVLVGSSTKRTTKRNTNLKPHHGKNCTKV
jgi:hypothetical protein